MRNKTKRFATLVCMAVISALAMLSGGCGGGGGGSAAPAATAPVKSNTGFGKVSAVVKLNPPAGREVGSTSATVTVSITISGVYKVSNEEFAPVTTSAVIDYTAGSAKITMIEVPVGVNHLVTVEADWGGYASETLKAIIPEVEDGAVASVTVDPVSTAIANAAIYITELEKSKLADLDPEDMAILQAGVADMAKNGASYYTMSGEEIVAYLAAAGIPAGVTLAPTTATVATTQTYQFDAALKDVNGVSILGATFTWTFASTATTTVGAVSSTGLFTASAEGSGVITASSNGFTATAAVTIISHCSQNAQCEDGNALTYDVCLNPGSAPTCEHTSIACAANSDCSGSTPVCSGGATLAAACVACVADLDCNDNAALTLDVCVQSAPARAAGIAISQSYPYCSNYPIACNTNSDCDDSNTNTTDTCSGGGTAMAACVNTPNGPTAASISIGSDHACSLQADGSVQCWGYNGYGQVGYDSGQMLIRRVGKAASSADRRAARKSRLDKSAASRGAAQRSAANAVDGSMYFLEPYTVPGILGATAIIAKSSATCALFADGSAKCWGYNYSGQLGNGVTTNSYVPTTVTGLTGAIQIEIGGDNTCAVLGNGGVQCWGYNGYGQLGDGTTNNSSVPVTMTGLSGPAAQVAVGGDSFTCVLINDGTVQCIGYGGYGQLGDGAGVDSAVLVTVSGITNAVAITAGYDHACALLSDTTVKCWGENYDGQLGDGTQTKSNSPVAVSGLTGVASITAGDYHTCALLSGGAAKCWGYNSHGELGVAADANHRELLPATVTKVSGAITGIDGGEYSTCFITTGGAYKCLGNNYSGQLGNGRGIFNSVPISEFGLTGVSSLSISYSACAITTGGSLSCWGYNGNGQLGTGDNVTTEEPVTAAAYTSIIGIAMGGGHSCAIASGGALACVGYNYNGQLGDGSYTNTTTPVPVTGLSGAATAVAAFSNVSCAIISGGAVQCWGDNLYGQLGNATNTSSNIPVTVSGLAGPATAVSMNYGYVCALINDGGVQCWGYNYNGQLGNGSNTDSNVPVTVSGVAGATAISAGGGSACAVVGGGEVKCWGSNNNGQLGDGTYTSSNIPVTVSGLTGAVAVGVSNYSSCALINDGTIKCWGYNGYGNLGNNSTTSSVTPVSVYGITDATAIYAGSYRICANSASSGLLCWGPDLYWYGD